MNGTDDQHDAARRALGRVGVWTFALDGLHAPAVRDTVCEIEAMGYPTLWIPEGMGSREVFANAGLLLSTSDRLTVATGIANIGARHAITMELGRRALADAHPGRFVLGMGVGHEYQAELRGVDYARPRARMAAYLDRMDRARSNSPDPAVPAPRMLAALGPWMLELAAARTAGAHTYFVPVAHTERARELLGPGPVLAVEQTVVLESDPGRARRLARGFAIHYLELPNYANNLRRLGFSDDDVAREGSDRLVDATIAWGDTEAIVARVRHHLEAGADHVCVQVVSEDDAGLGHLRRLAPALLAL